MNIERRGKYPGVKIHLDEVETRRVLDVLFGPGPVGAIQAANAFKIVAKMAKLIEKELVEDPALLDARTEAEILAELLLEREKANEKIARIEAGLMWNGKGVGK